MYFLAWITPAFIAVTCDVAKFLGSAGVTEVADETVM